MIFSILSVIIGAAIIIGILRSIIEAFPVIKIVITVILAIIAFAAVSYAVYRLVIFIKANVPEEERVKIVKKSKKENNLDFLDVIKKDEENQRNFWEE